VVVPSIEDGIEFCKSQTGKWGNEVFIIGGGEIYRQSMRYVDVIYLTRIHQTYSGDATYPKVDLNVFKEVDRRERPGYTFLTYKRYQ
jgi:dihydrofolate reductase